MIEKRFNEKCHLLKIYVDALSTADKLSTRLIYTTRILALVAEITMTLNELATLTRGDESNANSK